MGASVRTLGGPRIGVYDLNTATILLSSTVERLDPDYKGPWDPQALIEYLEALVLRARHADEAAQAE